MMDLPAMEDCRRRAAFAHLVDRASSRGPDRWKALEAAHVLGQERFWLHLCSHWYMLALAVREREVREAAGQLFRILLVPLGHLSGRLPLGNPGRATVSAFAPMPVSAELVEILSAQWRSRPETVTPRAESNRSPAI